MDKAYKGDIPRHKKALVALKREFSRILPATDWSKLRVEPMLEHVTSLERVLRSPKFSREITRLRKGVGMFHSDLVYLRANIKALKEILADEKRRVQNRQKTKRPNKTPEPTTSAMPLKHRIYSTPFANVYPYYIAKAEKKGRTRSEVDTIICWLTGYKPRDLELQLKAQKVFETFFKEAPKLHPSRTSIKGVICGVRIEEIQDPLMREIRYLDKLVDELAKGKTMEKILRA